MIKNRVNAMLLAVLLLFPQELLVACASKPGSVPAPITITFVVASYPWLPDRSADYERLARAFHETHPQVTVQIKPVDLSELSQGLANADFLTSPEWGIDVLLTSTDRLPELIEHGLLRDLGPVLEGNPALGAADFYPSALNTLRWQGELYGLPAELDPWVMFYNLDLFDAADVAYPSGNWRWDDFLETARALTSSPSLSSGFAFGSWGGQLTPFIYQNDGKVVDDPVMSEKATLNDPATVEAVRWYVNLALLEGVMSTPTQLADYAISQGRGQKIVTGGDAADKAASQARADLEQAVSSGDVAMWMGRLSDQGGRWEPWDFRWGVVPLPTGRQTATLATVQGYFITSHSEHFDQALQWTDFLTRQPPLYGGLPVRRSVSTDDAFLNQLRPEITASLNACLEMLENGVVVPESLDWWAAQWLQGPLFSVLLGEQTIEEALEMAQQQALEEIDQE
jgi:multiple sugar transport system substrate-binding protein